MFSVRSGLESGKICTNNNDDHACIFIALTLARSLSSCKNTWPDGLVFKQLPQDPANGNA